jgi:hydroxyethylthiazole kinase
MTVTARTVWADVLRIRESAPLVHNITNYVVMNSTANALLSLGASPVMAHAEDEAADMTGLASALVLNLGTLSRPWVAAMLKSARAAKKRGLPVVLDPVGAGATPYRTTTACRLVETGAVSLVRGNASEILALSHAGARTKGVDALVSSSAAVDAARVLAAAHRCAVAVSGETDYVTDGERLVEVKNGHAMMPKVTGLGCTASALCGAFLAVNPSAVEAAAHAMVVMGLAGEAAGRLARGPGSFQMHFLDALYGMGEKEIAEGIRVADSG